MNKLLLASALTSVAMSVAFSAQGQNLDFRGKMKEGLYETTTKMEMPGLPAGLGSMVKPVQRCTTKEDMEKGKDMFRDPKHAHETSCEIKNVKQDGNTMSYDTVCPKEGMTSSTVLAFADNGVKGVTKMKMSGEKTKGMPPGMGDMTMSFESKYLGPCTK